MRDNPLRRYQARQAHLRIFEQPPPYSSFSKLWKASHAGEAWADLLALSMANAGTVGGFYRPEKGVQSIL